MAMLLNLWADYWQSLNTQICTIDRQTYIKILSKLCVEYTEAEIITAGQLWKKIVKANYIFSSVLVILDILLEPLISQEGNREFRQLLHHTLVRDQTINLNPRKDFSIDICCSPFPHFQQKSVLTVLKDC